MERYKPNGYLHSKPNCMHRNRKCDAYVKINYNSRTLHTYCVYLKNQCDTYISCFLKPRVYGPPVPPQAAPEEITKAVASLPPEQMFELMKQMQVCVCACVRVCVRAYVRAFVCTCAFVSTCAYLHCYSVSVYCKW